MVTSIYQIREQYPEYDKYSDRELSDALYKKFGYEGRIDKGEFDRQIGVVDLDQDSTAIRKQIGAMEEDVRDQAHMRWAEKRVKDLPVTPAPRGSGVLGGGMMDELGAAATSIPNSIARQFYDDPDEAPGLTYEEALAETRAREKVSRERMPVANTLMDVGAGIASFGPGRLVAAAPQAAIAGQAAQQAPRTLAGGQGVMGFGTGRGATTLPGMMAEGVGIGAGTGALEGFTRGEGGLGERLGSAQSGALWGGGLGAAIPPAMRGLGVVGAGATRAGRAALNRLRSNETVADEMMLRQMAEAGETPASIAAQLGQGRRAQQLGPGSRAELPETIADISDPMAREAGKVYRSGGEAGQAVDEFFRGRQQGPVNPFEPTPGLRNQRARVIDSTARALQVRSRPGGYQSMRELADQQKQTGDALYRQAMSQQQPVDLTNLEARLTANQTNAVGKSRKMYNAVAKELARVRPNNLRQMDAFKKDLDDRIGRALQRKEKNLARELGEIRRDLLDAIHANGANPRYRDARAAWAQDAEMQNAVRAGRRAAKEPDEARTLYESMTDAERKFFRIGLMDDISKRTAGQPGRDASKVIYDTNMNQVLDFAMPEMNQGMFRQFADRGQRLGELASREQRMVRARNIATGGSPTARNIQDDAEYAVDLISAMTQRLRNPNIMAGFVEALGVALQRFFGYRQGVGRELARRLTTTDRREQMRILRRLSRQGNRQNFAQFIDALNQLGRATAAQGGAAAGKLSNYEAE